jgi:ADP-ribose pyrophosphatase
VFRVERVSYASADGATRFKDIVRHPGAVAVIAQHADGRLVLVRNRRVAVGQRLVEFCAGKLEPGEPPAQTALRELEEETGFAAGRLEALGSFFTSPGFADEIMHVFVASDLRPVPQRLEPGEEIEVVTLAEDELRAAIASGEILDGKTLGAYLLWSMKRAGPGACPA